MKRLDEINRNATSAHRGKCRSRVRRGLSLIEVVLAIVILGLSIPPIAVQISSAINDRVSETIDERMTRLASERLSEIVADHANPTRGYAYIDSAAYPAENAAGGLGGYQRVTTIREVSGSDYITPSAGSGLKRLLIEITSPDGRSMRIESLVANIPGFGLVSSGK